MDMIVVRCPHCDKNFQEEKMKKGDKELLCESCFEKYSTYKTEFDLFGDGVILHKNRTSGKLEEIGQLKRVMIRETNTELYTYSEFKEDNRQLKVSFDGVIVNGHLLSRVYDDDHFSGHFSRFKHEILGDAEMHLKFSNGKEVRIGRITFDPAIDTRLLHDIRFKGDLVSK